MTPETITRAVYEISQAAPTQREAQLGGAELGRMIAAQFRRQASARIHLGTASDGEIESCLRRLAIKDEPYFADVAAGALEAWRREMRRTETTGC